jgi:hypothetical protein
MTWYYRWMGDVWMAGIFMVVVFPLVLIGIGSSLLAGGHLRDYRALVAELDARAGREVGRVAACEARSGATVSERAALVNACLLEQLPTLDTPQAIARALTALEPEGGSVSTAQLATMREALARGREQLPTLSGRRRAAIENYCSTLRWRTVVSGWDCAPDVDLIDEAPLSAAEAKLRSAVVRR